MPMTRTGRAVLVAAALAVIRPPTPAAAQEAAETGWSFKGEFSAVVSEGNSSALTLGLGGTLRRVWENARWQIEATGVRTESGVTTRTAVGTASDYEISADTERKTTAENYRVKTRYDRDLSETAFLSLSSDWLRNTFAGIRSRLVMGLGAGRSWWDDEESRLETGLAGTFTIQEDVVPSKRKNDYPGVRGSYEYWRQVTGSSEFESSLAADLNLDNTRDLRLDWTNSLSVAINSALALKPSLQLQWRNEPSLTEVPLMTPGGEDTGETVQVPLEKLDTLFRLALVVTL